MHKLHAEILKKTYCQVLKYVNYHLITYGGY